MRPTHVVSNQLDEQAAIVLMEQAILDGAEVKTTRWVPRGTIYLLDETQIHTDPAEIQWYSDVPDSYETKLVWYGDLVKPPKSNRLTNITDIT